MLFLTQKKKKGWWWWGGECIEIRPQSQLTDRCCHLSFPQATFPWHCLYRRMNTPGFHSLWKSLFPFSRNSKPQTDIGRDTEHIFVLCSPASQKVSLGSFALHRDASVTASSPAPRAGPLPQQPMGGRGCGAAGSELPSDWLSGAEAGRFQSCRLIGRAASAGL